MNPLDQLHPLIAPAPVSLWPPAPGWWLLLAVLPLLWLLFQAGVLLLTSGEGFGPAGAQGALIGLPLIALCDMLRQAGMNPLGDA
mgnify:CR=1 FL=1